MPKVLPSAPTPGGGRLTRARRVSATLAEINVIPLVDVMLVLLIIFMVTAPMMTQGLAVNLPQARRAAPVTAQPLYVTIPASFAKDHVLQIGNDEVRVEILQERMKQAMLEREDKSVFVRSDAAVTMQDFMTVTDKLKEGGVEKVAISTRPVERQH